MLCPACDHHTLKPHCRGEATDCTWYRCSYPECKATLDLDQRRAFKPGEPAYELPAAP